MQGCLACRRYEEGTMARARGEPGPEPTPCDHYEMSPRFRAWLVGRMRDEVGPLIAASGLDRTLIARARPKPAATDSPP